MALAPSGALLQARFLELDVMRAKLARARPISETELSFLGTFHLRFRKAFADAPPPAATADSAPQDEAPETEAAPPAPPRPDPKPRPAAPKVSPVNPPAARPKKDSEHSVKAPAGGEATAPSAPPKRPVRSAAIPAGAAGMGDDEDTVAERRTIGDRDRDDEPSAKSPAAPEHAGDDDSDSRVGPKKLAEALEANDHRTVLRELYREVTAIAEGVWTSDVTPAPLVWEQVTASDWYEHNFSRLGLHPLSVFYEVTANVEKMMRTGGTKKDLQELLKEMNFAKTLLALRDMFQANNL
jgi:outer membrane biosynthesis protein TonB